MTNVDFSDCQSCYNAIDFQLFADGPQHHHPWWKLIIPKRHKSILSLRLITTEVFITSNHLPFFSSFNHSTGHQSREISIGSIASISLHRSISCFRKQLVGLLFHYRGIQWNPPQLVQFWTLHPRTECVLFTFNWG